MLAVIKYLGFLALGGFATMAIAVYFEKILDQPEIARDLAIVAIFIFILILGVLGLAFLLAQ